MKTASQGPPTTTLIEGTMEVLDAAESPLKLLREVLARHKVQVQRLELRELGDASAEGVHALDWDAVEYQRQRREVRKLGQAFAEGIHAFDWCP